MKIERYSFKEQFGAGGDDLTVTHHQSPEVQSNSYYPFGLQHPTSWTRSTTVKNNRLYNAGSEYNEQTKNYETFYRQYDPALGRFTAIDPLATKYTSTTPYNYAFNDPLGDDPANCIVCNRTNYSTTLERMRAGDSDLASRGQSLISYGGITGEQYDQMQKDAKELSPAEFAKKYGVSISIFDILKCNPHGGKNNVSLVEWLENGGNYDQYKAKLASGEEPYLDLGAWEINLSNVVVDQNGGNASLNNSNSRTNEFLGWAAGINSAFALANETGLYQMTKGGTLVRLAEKGKYLAARNAAGGAAILNVVIAGMQLANSDGSGADIARFVGAGLIFSTSFIPVVGPTVSFLLTIADTAGAFDGIYNQFDDPTQRAMIFNSALSGGLSPIGPFSIVPK